MTKNIPKAYEPAEAEKKWYTWWEKQGLFQAHPGSGKAAYSIVLPPPNVTGSLHMGHALNITLQDIIIRWKRMQGFDVLWLPGTDHAGIATQNVVERHLAEQGKKRTDLGREKFEQIVWQWKEKAETDILNQIRRLGCSCDWSRNRFTFDDGLSRAVREVFVRLYQDGLIYRGEYLVNWCPRCCTAISDLEVEYEPTQGKLWHIKYPLKGSSDFVVVATTRPETMLGDTAVAVHPEDERYTHLTGRTVILPLMEREIHIITDDFVDRKFGTGVVKVTPGHDPYDFEVGQRQQLPIVKVIGEDGRMTEAAGRYAKMDRYEARKGVVADLEKQGLLMKVEDHSHNVGHCQRCETVVEPLVSTQWFAKVKPLAEAAIRAVKEKQTVFVPENYEKIYFEWMHNIHDWCISRQLWWGHRIPAWYCPDCGEITVAREAPEICSHCESRSLEQESDVLDTWFSSALWPFSTMGWPDHTKDLQVYYSTNTLVTASDIIFFWVARMMMMGLRFMGEVPFRTVYFNGMVRDEHGQKMAKSRGNVIDPLEIMDEYGTDAMRFTLAVMAVPGTNIPFSVSRMAGYRHFCNKIWNAARFLLLNLEHEEPVTEKEIDELWREENQLEVEERWMLSRLQKIISDTNENFEKFRFHEASNQLYHFFWHEFCDWFIELAKVNITSHDVRKQRRASRVTAYLLETCLKLLHPFIPFITEELWQQLPHLGDSLMIAPYPVVHQEWVDLAVEKQMGGLQELISAVRTARAENNIDPRKRVPLQLLCNDEHQSFLQSQLHHLKTLAQLDQVEFVSNLERGGIRVQGVSRMAEFSLILDEVVDVGAERQRLIRQINRFETSVQQLQEKLQNTEFLHKAPEQVVTDARKRYEEVVEQLRKLKEKLNGLSRP
ncbi:valine--tRNA ligase [Acidobacteria bacterium AH-259-L09]|nr:valine--tRNA ligase [Acidobacteria bacterium AH-259-L09]